MAVTIPTRDEVARVLAEKSLTHFIKQAWHVIEPSTLYLHNWHISAMCEYLEAVDSGQITRLLINIPPRYMKSITVSVMWPVWSWIKNPGSRWMFASYAASLSTEHSINRRDIIKSEWYQERWADRYALTTDQNVKTEYKNDKQGRMFSTSFGGIATGKGGDRVVIDDPHDPKRAESDVQREGTVTTFSRKLSTRLNNKKIGAIVVVMQRVHEKDVSAVCIDQGYTHLCLPAEDEPRKTISCPSGRIFARDESGLLWPEREGPKEIAQAKVQLTAYGYAGQYQQCLVAGTMVETRRGPVPIESVEVDDSVLTRNGWRSVLWSGQTKLIIDVESVLFGNGSILTGTPDHPVFTTEFDFVALDSLSGGLYNLALWEGQDCQQRSASNSKAMNTFAQKAVCTLPESSKRAEKGLSSGFTLPCGGIIGETSPMASMSITRTRTQAIIRLRILNACLRASILSGTLRDCERRSIEDFLEKSLLRAMGGTSLRKGSDGIRSMAESLSGGSGKAPSIDRTFVLSAVEDLNQGHFDQTGSSSVPHHARKGSEFAYLPIGSVPNAGGYSHQKTGEVNAVRCLAGQSFGVPVYDLEIEGEHEFFANGILVHNSPSPSGGGRFKISWLRYWRRAGDVYELLDNTGTFIKAIPVAECDRFAIMDPAGTDADQNDKACFTCTWVFDLTPDGSLLVIHEYREQVEIPAGAAAMVKLSHDFDLPWLGVEKNGIGLGSVQTIKKHGVTIKVILAKGSKEARSETAEIRMAAGLVYLPYVAPWRFSAETELQSFPVGEFCDRIDVLSHACRYVQKVKGEPQTAGDEHHRATKDAALAEDEAASAAPGSSAEVLTDEPQDIDAWLNGK